MGEQTALQVPESRRGRSLARLRAAARSLFVREGYDRTRPQDIARAAGLASGTFYLHFADKKAAFMDFARGAQDEFLDACEAQLSSTPPAARLSGFFDVVETFSKEHPGVLQAAFVDPVTIDPDDDGAWELYDRMGSYVEQRLSRLMPGIADLGLVSHGICGLIRHAMTYANRRGVSREALLGDLNVFLEGGLRAIAAARANSASPTPSVANQQRGTHDTTRLLAGRD